MTETPAINSPKGKPPRADHMVAYGLFGNTYLALRVDASGNVISVLPGGTPALDEVTNAQVMIGVPHHEVHEGEMWTTGAKTPNGTPLANDATLAILLQTGARYGHIVGEVWAEGNSEVDWFEGTTFSAAGAALTEVSMNRNLVAAATVVATQDPTVTLAGTSLSSLWVLAGTRQGAVGGVIRQDLEWNLAPNTTYMLRVTNRIGVGSTSHTSINLTWYEETDV